MEYALDLVEKIRIAQVVLVVSVNLVIHNHWIWS